MTCTNAKCYDVDFRGNKSMIVNELASHPIIGVLKIDNEEMNKLSKVICI